MLQFSPTYLDFILEVCSVKNFQILNMHPVFWFPCPFWSFLVMPLYLCKYILLLLKILHLVVENSYKSLHKTQPLIHLNVLKRHDNGFIHNTLPQLWHMEGVVILLSSAEISKQYTTFLTWGLWLWMFQYTKVLVFLSFRREWPRSKAIPLETRNSLIRTPCLISFCRRYSFDDFEQF